jgi:ABC-2 type transport system ATP-binding protein
MRNETVEKLQLSIREGRFGIELDLLRFVSGYSDSSELNKRAVMLGVSYNRPLSDPNQAADKDSIRSEMLRLVEDVQSEYDEKKNHGLRQELMQKEFEFSELFAKRTQVAFRCSGLKKSFKSKFTLGPVDLEIRRGQITAVVGENGNGKTTLFRIIAGELSHDAGLISYPGIDMRGDNKIDWEKVKSKIAYVPQELPRWWGDLQSNLQYEAAIHGIRGMENLKEVEYVIERLDLRKHLDQRWKTLSGGYKLRFALARALVWKPEILILDEPLANLDVNAQLSMLRDIKNLATSLSHPMAVLISSQHIHEIEAIAENLVFLREGKIVFNQPISNLGASRSENTFEIKTPLRYRDFIGAFPEEFPVHVMDTGIHFLVQTPKNVAPQELLKVLLDRGVPVEYFRDISCSSKIFFLHETAQLT